MVSSEIDALKAKFQNTLKKFDGQSEELDAIFKKLAAKEEEVGLNQKRVLNNRDNSSTHLSK